MIVFDLRCGHGHVFEAWFGSSAAYEEQRAGGMIACPMCGSAEIGKAVMAPNVAAKGNRRSDAPPAPPAATELPPEAIKAAIEQGGTTLRDFIGGDGQPGYFQQELFVYGRGGQPCKVCGTELREVKLGQRASVYCPRCQR